MYHIKDAPLVAPVDLTDSIKNNHGLRNLSADVNLCFFRCLAVHQGENSHWCKKAAKNLFYKFCKHFDVTPKHFDFFYLEDFIKFNLIVYEFDHKTGKLVQHSREFYRVRMFIKIICRKTSN